MKPSSSLSLAVLSTLEGAINYALAMDPETGRHLAELEGYVVALHLRGVELTLYMLPGEEGMTLMGRFEGEADTTISAAPLSLLRMAGGKAGEGMFSGEVTIRGNVELGHRFQRILESIDIDWEEHVSRLTGDVVAHRLGSSVRALLRWGQRSGAALEQDLADYLQEELGLLPTRGEVGHFLDQVDTLRSDADRLEARVRRLQRHLPTQD